MRRRPRGAAFGAWSGAWCGAWSGAWCIALAACTAPSAARAPAAPAPAFPVITLTRGGCYGGCAPSSLELRGDGTVVRTVVRTVARVGGPRPGGAAADTAAGAVAAGDVRRLAARLERDGFLALAPAYVAGASACGPFAPDAPTVTLALHTARGRHAVRHDHGCADAPRLLLTLEAAVDSVGDPRRWLRSPTAGDRR